VTVPTEVKTCYLVMLDIPRNVSAEAHVNMVDVQKVDMRFSSITNCAAGVGDDGLWDTALEFKTYVHPWGETNRPGPCSSRMAWIIFLARRCPTRLARLSLARRCPFCGVPQTPGAVKVVITY
jgi:hypothetical protein